MRAFTIDSVDVQPSLRDDLPEPEPGANELLVRVHNQRSYALGEAEAAEALGAPPTTHTRAKLGLSIA